MNVTKKTISMIIVALVVMRLFVINVSASFAAPVMAEETLKLLFIEALSATGSYSADDLEAWEYEDLRNEFDIQMTTNPNFNAKKVLPVLVSDDLSVIPGSPEDIAKKEAEMIKFREQTDKVVSDWLNYMQSTGEDVYDYLYDFINPTYNTSIDMLDGTSLIRHYFDDGSGYEDIYCRSPGIVRNRVEGNDTWTEYVLNDVYRKKIYNISGSLISDYEPSYTYQEIVVTRFGLSKKREIYGKWVTEGGELAETDDKSIPVIGEAAGTQVTPDMLNPDGTVTIGGTTYYPKDFIDWDKFKDPAIIDLLNKILAKIDDMPVTIEQDKPIVDSVDVPAELSDFTTPGIANVFPFCLPWDFVRGMHLLKSEPEVPHFETEIKIPAFLNVPEQKWKFEIDFKEFEPLARITRWCSLLSFVYVLILITPKICKGAG